MSKKIEIKKGDRYGRLVIVEEINSIKKQRKFKCKCDCGIFSIVRIDSLRGCLTQSCGCLKEEKKLEATITHGMTKSREYKSWQAMKERCSNTNAPNYKRYGGAEIKICKTWNDFKNFYKDMGERPINTSLDRINTSGNYEPNNCRWATPQQQNRNKSNNVIVTFNGKTMCANEWSKQLKGSRTVVATRLKRGWSREEALTTPIRIRKNTN